MLPVDGRHLMVIWAAFPRADFCTVLRLGACIKFNNATQRVFGGIITPVVYAWQTNDPANPWYAEARRKALPHST